MNVKFFRHFEMLGKPYWILIGFTLIAGIGFLDILTGYELAFSLFYLIPIFLLAWYAGQGLGVAAAVASAFAWLVADVLAGSSYAYPFVYAWNTLIRFIFFMITVFLLANLKTALKREKELARMDYLTGAINSRYFLELLQMEIDRFQRYEHPFTLAYIDLDSFKAVNDQFGHSVGDEVLHMVVGAAKTCLRKTDLLARLGGDEFALLLPETDGDSARVTIPKVRDGMARAMQAKNWSVTFSIGVVTCKAAPPAAEELLRQADELMYAVKRSGKKAIAYSTYAG